MKQSVKNLAFMEIGGFTQNWTRASEFSIWITIWHFFVSIVTALKDIQNLISKIIKKIFLQKWIIKTYYCFRGFQLNIFVKTKSATSLLFKHLKLNRQLYKGLSWSNFKRMNKINSNMKKTRPLHSLSTYGRLKFIYSEEATKILSM